MPTVVTLNRLQLAKRTVQTGAVGIARSCNSYSVLPGGRAWLAPKVTAPPSALGRGRPSKRTAWKLLDHPHRQLSERTARPCCRNPGRTMHSSIMGTLAAGRVRRAVPQGERP